MVLRALVPTLEKEGSSPTYLFHVIARGSSDKEINKVHHHNPSGLESEYLFCMD